MTRERLWGVVLTGWGIAAAVLIAVSWSAITHLWFPDPDDAMRLTQVRDWLNGQSWWDVSQHRLWDGHFAMHWSRLVDLPLALVMFVFHPLVGQGAATRIAVTVVPLVTLLAVMALGAALTRRLCGFERAKIAVLLTPLSVPMLYQLRPLRVDHHGWQIVFAMLAVLALLGRPGWRSGMVVGGALAILLTISLEGLPVSAAIIGVALLAWALDPSRRAQALSAVWTLSGLVTLLHIATRGPAMFSPACDAVAPAWIAALGVAAIGSSIAMLVPRTTMPARAGMLMVAGVAALFTLAAIDPLCLRGPFASLDPFVRRFWYDNVSEGMPVWAQVPSWAVMTVAFPIVGLIGGALAWRASTGQDRTRWTMMLALSAASFALSILVIRTGSTANALALPGGAWALHAMLTRARHSADPVANPGDGGRADRRDTGADRRGAARPARGGRGIGGAFSGFDNEHRACPMRSWARDFRSGRPAHRAPVRARGRDAASAGDDIAQRDGRRLSPQPCRAAPNDGDIHGRARHRAPMDPGKRCRLSGRVSRQQRDRDVQAFRAQRSVGAAGAG